MASNLQDAFNFFQYFLVFVIELVAASQEVICRTKYLMLFSQLLMHFLGAEFRKKELLASVSQKGMNSPNLKR